LLLKNPLFKELAHDIALQIAAMAPMYISPADIPERKLLIKKKKLISAEFKDSKKPEKIINQIIEGKLRKVVWRSLV